MTEHSQSIKLRPGLNQDNTKAYALRTVEGVCNYNRRQMVGELRTPIYHPQPDYGNTVNLGLAVASMKDHMTDEGKELFNALECGGYVLCGKGLTIDNTDVKNILSYVNAIGSSVGVSRVNTLVLQDKREWDGKTAVGSKIKYDLDERYTNVELLANRRDIFKLTVLKDAQNNQKYHALSAHEIGCHAWVVYYHPDIVKAVAPYVRLRHLVRTYHTVNPDIVPLYSPDNRKGIILSGATGSAYPLRTFITDCVRTKRLTGIDILKHPGYHRSGSNTPQYLQTLSRYKVAICTSSRYGYALRKIVEASACGCIVVTDLPVDDVLPDIDGNLVRVPATITLKQLQKLFDSLVNGYDSEKQMYFAALTKGFYDYRMMGRKLASDIEALRRNYK